MSFVFVPQLGENPVLSAQQLFFPANQTDSQIRIFRQLCSAQRSQRANMRSAQHHGHFATLQLKRPLLANGKGN